MTKMEIARIAAAILTENNSYNYGGSDENTELEESFCGRSNSTFEFKAFADKFDY